MTEKKHIQPKEAQEAIDSINKMQQAGLKRVLPTPIWLGAILGVLVGTQITLLGAEIRTYNTILIVLILIMAIAIINTGRITCINLVLMLTFFNFIDNSSITPCNMGLILLY